LNVKNYLQGFWVIFYQTLYFYIFLVVTWVVTTCADTLSAPYVKEIIPFAFSVLPETKKKYLLLISKNLKKCEKKN